MKRFWKVPISGGCVPKKDWQGPARQFFFYYDNDHKILLSCLQRLYSVVSVIPKEGLAGPRPPILLLV